MPRRLAARLALLVLIVAAPCARPSVVLADKDAAPEFVPGRILARFLPGVASHTAAEALEEHGGRVEEVLEELGVVVLSLPAKADPRAFAHAFAGHPAVEFAEPDWVFPADEVTPDDASYAGQWHLPKIACPQAWVTTTGDASVIIAILDTGVDGEHPDLAANLVAGWNFYDGNADTSDVHGHGTAVAGAAAAATDNGTGVAGVAWKCRLMPCRVSDTQGYATTSLIAKALTWSSDQGARVANVSYRVSTSAAVKTAAQYFQDHGGVVTVSSGNEAAFESAADNPFLLTVGSTTSSDARSSFSNTGNNLDLVAPGSSILTTTRGGGYGTWSGTSFSAPIAAGAAALVLSANPYLSGAQAAEIVELSADDLGSAGWDTSFGQGRLNAAAAVAAALGGTPAPEPAPTPDVTAPTIAITAPAAGAKVSGTVTITVAASDDVGVVSVELWVDGALVQTATVAPFATRWNAKKAAAGTHTLECRAYDAAGNVGTSASVSVRR
jgi:thermitase